MGGFQTPTQGSGDKSEEVPFLHKNYSDDNFKHTHTHKPPPRPTFYVSERRAGRRGSAVENAAALVCAFPNAPNYLQLSGDTFLIREKSDLFKIR